MFSRATVHTTSPLAILIDGSAPTTFVGALLVGGLAYVPVVGDRVLVFTVGTALYILGKA